MLMGQQMGKDIFLEYQDRFNFGLRTNIDLYGESRTQSLVFNSNNMGPTELATSTFGQGYNATMIQMISGFCSLINGGYYYEPHVVKKVINPSGGVSEIIDTTLVKRTVTEEVSAQMRQILLESVTDGIAKGAKIKGYDIAGKSGTAQKLPREDKTYIVSFIGYATDNDDEPALVCYVAVDEPVTEGTQSAVPIKLFKAIMEEVLPYMNIFPESDQPSNPSDQPENPDSGADNGDFDLPMIEEN
jgi:stage V sporulation protein D (sporulation-specific penicillin-binding protein)